MLNQVIRAFETGTSEVGRGLRSGAQELQFLFSNRRYIEHIIAEDHEKRQDMYRQIANLAVKTGAEDPYDVEINKRLGAIAAGVTMRDSPKFEDDRSLEFDDEAYMLRRGRLPGTADEPEIEPAVDTQSTNTT